MLANKNYVVLCCIDFRHYVEVLFLCVEFRIKQKNLGVRFCPYTQILSVILL